MPKSLLTVEIQPDSTSVTVFVAGALDLSNVATLRSCLEQLDPAFRTVLLDMEGLEFIDSSGLGAIAGAQQRFGPQLRQLLVCNPSHNVRRVLEISGLDEVLDIVP